jgi:hypothetical protein
LTRLVILKGLGFGENFDLQKLLFKPTQIGFVVLVGLVFGMLFVVTIAWSLAVAAN